MREIKSGIYKITNIVNNHAYVGSATNVKRRWIEHKSKLSLNKHGNSHLQNAYNKYGSENFEFSILEDVVDNDKLLEREQFYIDTLNPEYNIRKIAENNFGLKHSQESKNKISNSGKGKTRSGQTKQRISEALQGRILSQEHRDNLSRSIRDVWSKIQNPMTGKHHSEESKKKISEALFGKYTGKNSPHYGVNHTQETKDKISQSKADKVLCIETGVVYLNAKEASMLLGVHVSSINKCCNGTTKTSGGLHWIYQKS